MGKKNTEYSDSEFYEIIKKVPHFSSLKYIHLYHYESAMMLYKEYRNSRKAIYEFLKHGFEMYRRDLLLYENSIEDGIITENYLARKKTLDQWMINFDQDMASYDELDFIFKDLLKNERRAAKYLFARQMLKKGKYSEKNKFLKIEYIYTNPLNIYFTDNEIILFQTLRDFFPDEAIKCVKVLQKLTKAISILQQLVESDYKAAKDEYNNTMKKMWQESRKNKSEKPNIHDEPLLTLDLNAKLGKMVLDFLNGLLSTKDGYPYYIGLISITEKIDSVDYQNFFVYSDIVPCEEYSHTIEAIRASIPVLTADGEIKNIVIKAHYCNTCDVYYISNATYIQLIQAGRPLCQVISYIEYKNTRKNMSTDWAEESLLRKMGYSVSKQHNLSDIERHNILDAIIAQNLMTRNEIIGYLRFFIKERQFSKKNMSNAIAKWARDIDYLNSQISHQNIIYINRLIRKK